MASWTKYKWDAKQNKYVVVSTPEKSGVDSSKNATSNGSASTASATGPKGETARSNTKNSASQSKTTQYGAKNSVAPNIDTTFKTLDESQQEWQEFLRKILAGAARNDLAADDGIIENAQMLDEQMNQRGAKNGLDFLKFQIGKTATNTGTYLENLRAGIDTLGLPENEASELLASAEAKANYADQLYARARARTGDASVLDEAQNKNAYNEYARLLRLYGYDVADEVMKQPLPAEMQRAATVPIDIPVDYDFKVFGDDIYRAKYGEEKDGTKLTEAQRQQYKRRVEMMTGIEDFDALSTSEQLNLTYDESYLEQIQAMNSGAQTYQDALNIAGRYTTEDRDRDIMTIRDYQEGHVQVSDDDYQRALDRIMGMTGMDLSTGAEEAHASIISADEDFRRTAAQPLMDVFGGQDANEEIQNYQQYIDSYARYMADQEREQSESAELERMLTDKWGNYSRGVYDPREANFMGGYSDADLIYELVAAGDDEKRRAEIIQNAGAIGNDFALDRRFNAGYQFMTDEERARFYDVWDKEGPEAGLEYLDDLSPKLLKMENARKEESYEQFANEKPVLANLTARLGTMVSAAEYFPNLISNALTGKQFSDAGSRFTQTVTGTTAQNIAEALPNANLAGRNIPALLYQAGTAAADSGLMALSGNPTFATLVLSSSAANTALTDALDSGKSVSDALRDSAAVGLIELITEKFSIDALLSDSSSLLGYISKNMATEASEEMASEILNIGYDIWAYGDESDVAQRFRELVVQGYSPNEAYAAVAKEKAGDVAESGFVGGISGGMGAAPRGVAIKSADASAGKNLQKNEAARSMLDLATEMLPEGEVKNLAKEQAAAIDGNGEVSNSKLGRVYREMLAAVDEHVRGVLEDTMVRNVREMLRARGVDDRALAAAVTRVAAGDGSASARDYMAVGANDAALELVKGLTDRISYARGLMGKVGEFAENASKKKTDPEAAQESEEVPKTKEEAPTDEMPAETGEELNIPDEDIQFEGMNLSDNEVSTTSDGEEVSIVGVESVGTDGEMMFKVETADGTQKNVRVSEVSLGKADEDTARLAAYAKEYGAGAASMFNARLPSQNVDEYAEAFQKAVQYGSDGRNIDTVSGYDSMKVLNRNQLGIAYEMGRAERVERGRLTQQHQSEKMTANGPVKVGSVDISGIKSISGLSKHQRRSIVAMRNVAELLGINIKVFESTANKDGKYTGKQGSWDPKTLTLALDIHAGSNNVMNVHSAMMHTAGHELTHMIYQFADTDIRAAYQEYVLGSLSQKMTEDELNYEIERTMKKPGVKSRDDAIEEIVAEASVEAFSKITEEDIAQLAETNQPLLRRIRKHVMQWIANMKKRIAKAFAGTEAKNEYAKMMNDQLDEMARMWNSALINATSNKESLRGDIENRAFLESMVEKEGRDSRWGQMLYGDRSSENTEVNDAAGEASEGYLWGLWSDEADDAGSFADLDSFHGIDLGNGDFAVDAVNEIKYSLRENEELMDKAIAVNASKGNIDDADIRKAAEARAKVAEFMRDDSRQLHLPEDLSGNTFFSDSAYGGTEENTTVCPRSIGADAFLDAVSDRLGRPLTVAEQVHISQDIIGAADIKDPQCIYCYVAADRAAYREFLGRYIDQRDTVIDALKRGETDMAKLFDEFNAGRKGKDGNPTKEMRKRFDLWVNTFRQGKKLLSKSDLANIGVLTAIQSDKYRELSGDPNFAEQMKDALKYAQAASWAKKRVNYVAYNGHILKWKPARIEKLNAMYGLRMYSFSDFSPAFALENMQMVTDAAVQGLKMLAYTKVPAFAEIFADTGMNINVSVFATEVKGDSGSSIVENNLMGADWKSAQKLRSEHENIGITFVATSDAQIEWALDQEWIDVVIPYHLVRTGRTIAEMMQYRNYTAESGDAKKPEWSKGSGNLSSIPAALHNNDRDTYMRLLEENNLEPRFARFVDHPNYMKLVNETRQSVTTSKPVQPIFNVDAAINALQDMANNGGYYVPIGGSEQRMYELANEFAEKVNRGEYERGASESEFADDSDVKFSVRSVSGHDVVWVDSDITKNKPADQKYTEFIGEYLTEHIGEVYTIIESGQKVYLGDDLPDEYTGSKYTKRIRNKGQEAFRAKNRAAADLGEAIEIGTNRRWEKTKHPHNKDAKFGVYRYSTRIAFPIMDSSGRTIKVNAYSADLLIRNASDGKKYLYDVVGIKNDAITADSLLKRETARQGRMPAKLEGIIHDNSVSENAQDVKLQLRDPEQVSDRELLANVMDSAAETQAELDFVRRYRSKIAELDKKQRDLEQTRQEIADARKNGVRKSDIAVMQNKATILRNQIDRMDGKLLEFEAGKPLQAVVKRQREDLRQKANERMRERVAEVRQQEAAKRDEMRERISKLREEKNARIEALKREKTAKVKEVRDEKNESFAKQKYRKRLEEDVNTLRTWVTSPTNKEHVPQFMRKPLGDMIASLDFSSVRSLSGGADTQKDQKLKDALDAMNLALVQLHSEQQGLDERAASFATIIDLPFGYNEEFTKLVAKIKTTLDATQASNDTAINRMTSAQLKELSQAIRTLTTSIRQMNRLLANAKYESAVTAANDTMDSLDKMKAKKDSFKPTEAIGKFMDWTNTVPYYAFKRFGEGGKAIFSGLMDGWDKLAFNTDKLVKFTEGTYTTKEVKKWAGEMHRVELDSGDSVRMTTAQLMSLYCLSKREQAVGHLLGGGIRIADIDSKGKRIVQSENYTLTQNDLQKFADELTARQREVADKLQECMSTQGAEWGNEISMKRFGYEMFTEKFYFPIETDANNRRTIDEQAQENSLFRLLNMSATKGLVKGANNAIVVRDIFDVFTAHSSDMAKYNALGLQILDAMKWLNYVERTQNDDGSISTRSVQKSLERAYGTDARKYILNLLRDLNGTREGGRNDGLANKVISNAKVASVAANVRVYLLQATSMPRAAYAISPTYLSIGLAKMMVNPVKAARTAIDKVGIAKWKSMGFYDTNISSNIREMVKHDQTVPDKIRKASMAPAGWFDNMTMGVIYYAAEAECAKKHPNTKKGSATWDKLVNDRVRDIVYQTQVVDSTMTRSDAMRGKGIVTLATSFMSEPTLTMNMLADSLYEARMNLRAGKSLKTPTARMVKAASVFTVTAVLTALMEALFDAERDDDEFETFAEKYMTALIGDITEDDTSWQKFTKVLFSNIGSNLNVLNNIPFVSDAFSIIEGYENSPMYSAFIDSFKSSYDAYQRYLEGKGTAYSWIYSGLKGVSQLTGLPVSNTAREAVSIWNTFFADPLHKPRIQTYANNKNDAAKAYYAAIGRGDSERAAHIIERARINGIPAEDIGETLVSYIKDDFISGNITEAAARNRLEQHTDKDADKIDEYIKEWSYQSQTGYKYNDMKADYISGAISRSDMQTLLAQYRGYDSDEVFWQLSEWDYAKAHDGESGGKMSWFLDAVEAGSGYEKYADELLAHGVDKGDIASRITSTFKEEYRRLYGTAAGDALREHLLDVYEYIGYDRDYEWNRYMSKWMND